MLTNISINIQVCIGRRLQSWLNSYLPGAGDYYDQQGSAPRARLAHCTSSELTPATTSNRRGSGAKFLIVGSSVRADPVNKKKYLVIGVCIQYII